MRQGCLDGYAMLGLRPVVHWFHYGLALLSVWCVLFIMCCSFFIIGHPYLILLFPFFIMWHTFLIKCYALFIMQYRPVMRTLAYLVWILCRVHFLSWVEFSLCDFLLSCKNFSCEGFHYVLWALYFFILWCSWWCSFFILCELFIYWSTLSPGHFILQDGIKRTAVKQQNIIGSGNKTQCRCLFIPN